MLLGGVQQVAGSGCARVSLLRRAAALCCDGPHTSDSGGTDRVRSVGREAGEQDRTHADAGPARVAADRRQGRRLGVRQNA